MDISVPIVFAFFSTRMAAPTTFRAAAAIRMDIDILLTDKHEEEKKSEKKIVCGVSQPTDNKRK